MTFMELTIYLRCIPLHSLTTSFVKHYGDGRVEGRGDARGDGRGDGRTPSGRDDTYSRRDY